MSYTVNELNEIVLTLKAAYKRAAESGGVTSYTINSGQSTTTVSQASLKTIREELKYYEDLLAEMTMYTNGEHVIAIRSLYEKRNKDFINRTRLPRIKK